MAATFELDAKLRQDVGKGASRRLRRIDDLVPGIIYGAKETPVLITIPHNKLMHALANESFYSHILTIHLDKKPQQVVLKALQRHPFKHRVLHVDFLRIRADEAIEMKVPLHFLHGDIAPGVKVGGGQVMHYVNEVEISCLPADLPEFIDVDLANLELDKTIYLSDLVLPPKVKLTANLKDEKNDVPVVTIHIPKVIEEPVEPTAPIETEILTEKAPTEEEAAAAAAGEKSDKKEKPDKKEKDKT